MNDKERQVVLDYLARMPDWQRVTAQWRYGLETPVIRVFVGLPDEMHLTSAHVASGFDLGEAQALIQEIQGFVRALVAGEDGALRAIRREWREECQRVLAAYDAGIKAADRRLKTEQQAWLVAHLKTEAGQA